MIFRKIAVGATTLLGIVTIVVPVALCMSATAVAQKTSDELETWQKNLIGNWNIEYIDAQHGTVSGKVAFKQNPGRPNKLFGRGVYYPPGTEKFFVVNDLRLENSILTGSYWPSFEYVRFRLALSPDDNTLTGKWNEKGWDNEESVRFGNKTYDNGENSGTFTMQGGETWTRANPRISSVEVRAIENYALDFPAMEERWQYASITGNLPKIALVVSGSDLPLWSRDAWVKVELFDDKLIFHTVEWDMKAGVLLVHVWLRKGTRPGRKLLRLNGVDAAWNLEYERFRPWDALPYDGVIPSRGMIREPTEPYDRKSCSCKTVTLARVVAGDYKPVAGGFVYDSRVLFEPGDNHTPPEAGPLRIPERDYRDRVCFYFSYPKALAYTVPSNKTHPCRARVEIRYPHTRSSTGYFENGWDLYTLQGMADFKSAAANFICIQVTDQYNRIPPGSGHISWKVNSDICKKEMPFDVLPKK